MFRLSSILKSIFEDAPTRSLDGNIVIWNLTNRCNLSCLHCYSRASLDSSDTFSTQKILSTIDELVENKIKFIIFSGGEPLVRKDIFEIANYARSQGVITYLSTNGLYINNQNAQKIVDTFNYIGVSIDGDEETHDYFRGLKGSFKKSLEAMRIIKNHGGKIGIRFTMTKATIDSLPFLFELCEKENFEKLYLSHLVYSGRGEENLEMDLTKEMRKKAVEFIFEKAFEYQKNGKNIEIVTGNMECDAVALLKKISEQHPDLTHKLETKLKSWGGNSSGKKLLNIDSFANVKPDPFFHTPLGNLHEDSFANIWGNKNNEMLSRLRESLRTIGGKCATCKYIEICNGGSRSRAFAMSGDLWGEDPSCYFESEELK